MTDFSNEIYLLTSQINAQRDKLNFLSNEVDDLCSTILDLKGKSQYPQHPYLQ